jgi:hypothetical protein
MTKARNSRVWWVIPSLLAISSLSFPAYGKYSGGTGEPNEPYQIATAEDLILLGESPEDYNKHFLLVNDVNMAGYTSEQFKMIGNRDYDEPPFTGVFDGNYNQILNYTWESRSRESIGIFVVVGDEGLIKKLVLENVDVNDPNCNGIMGALVAFNNGTIENCYGTGSVTGNGYNTGGLIAQNSGTVRSCYWDGSVTGFMRVGGLVGLNQGLIIDSGSWSTVSAESDVGGLVGLNYGEISNCDTVCEISGETNIGGLVGEAYGMISNSQSGGYVSGDSAVGGLIGKTRRLANISQCYSTGHVSGRRNLGGLVGSSSKECNIDRCYATGRISAEEYAGGLVGWNEGDISSCYTTGSVQVNANNAGGLVGLNGGTIRMSCAHGHVSGKKCIGGLVGFNPKDDVILFYDPIVTDSYASGSVHGEDIIGGLIGLNQGGTVLKCYSTGRVTGVTEYSQIGGLVGANTGGIPVENSFWDTATSSINTSDGGTGKTTSEMQTATTFLGVGWDFVDETTNGTEDIWKITDGLNYPCLSWEKYGGGTGEPNVPYLIFTAEQLNTIGLNQEDADKHFKLMADIDLSAYKGDSFNRIGFYEPPEYFPSWHPPFEGVFDGNNRTISNFTYVVDVNKPLREDGQYGDECVGLFGVVGGPAAQIKNLGLINPNIHPAITCTERVSAVGAIAGRLSDGFITNCYVKGGRISADMNVGGLVGSNLEGTISDCYTTCNVTWAKGRWLRPLDDPFGSTGYSLGGLVGYSRGWIYNCHATGSVQGDQSIGGLTGSSDSDWWNPELEIGVISNSYATGDVSGDKYVGGLAGQNRGKIDRCLAVGNVSGSDSVGGLVGNIDMEEGSISQSYSISNVSGNEQVGGLVGYSNGSILQSFTVSEVLGTVYVGGLVGFNGFGTIYNSYCWGSVRGSENVGALSGRNGKGDIYCCYAANTVNTVADSENVGGLLGGNVSGIVSECFWNIETGGLLDMCGFQGSSANGCNNTYGKTTTEMQTASTFLDAGWDFVDEIANGTEDIWRILEGQSYPRLSWEPQKYSGGTGEPNDPYWIIRVEDLLLLGSSPEDYDKHFRLMSNIDLSKYPYDRALIAPDMNTTENGFQGTSFSGVFDGNGHTIWNLTITGENYLGLIGHISGENAKIVDLGLLVPKIDAGTGGLAGSLVGHNEGTITNCYVMMGVVSGQGGLAGENYGTITKCYFTGNVSGISGVGGLVGLNGWLDGTGMISDCYVIGSVSGNNIVGGLVGRNESAIMSCYATSEISGNEPVGGLVGVHETGGTVVGSFWDIEISGLTTSAGGESKTTAEMQMNNTFLEAGWDFVDETANGTEDIWWIDEGQDYPRLWWETE